MNVTGNILIIDDEPQLRKTLARILQQEGFEVTTAENAQQGLDFLKNNNFDQQLARHVKPRNPFRNAIKFSWKSDDFAVVNDIEQISDIVTQFEKDRKGVPVLLKQYLKLGGTLLGFNVDHDFNNALDGLIMVDLVKTDAKVLNKYLGPQQTQAFLAFHEHALNKAS